MVGYRSGVDAMTRRDRGDRSAHPTYYVCFGSIPEVNGAHANVRSWGNSGHRHGRLERPELAIIGHQSRPPAVPAHLCRKRSTAPTLNRTIPTPAPITMPQPQQEAARIRLVDIAGTPMTAVAVIHDLELTWLHFELAIQ